MSSVGETPYIEYCALTIHQHIARLYYCPVYLCTDMVVSCSCGLMPAYCVCGVAEYYIVIIIILCTKRFTSGVKHDRFKLTYTLMLLSEFINVIFDVYIVLFLKNNYDEIMLYLLSEWLLII